MFPKKSVSSAQCRKKKRVAKEAKRKHVVPRKKKKARKIMTPKVKGRRKVKVKKGDAVAEREEMVETVARAHLEGPESRFVDAFQENGDPAEAPFFKFFVDPDVTADNRGDLDINDDNRTQFALMIDGMRRQR